MNRVEPKDLVPGQLYQYVEYQGEGAAPSQTLVQILRKTDTEITAQKVMTGEVFEPFPIYTYFEAVLQNYVELQLKHLRAEQQRIAAKIAIFESL